MIWTKPWHTQDIKSGMQGRVYLQDFAPKQASEEMLDLDDLVDWEARSEALVLGHARGVFDI